MMKLTVQQLFLPFAEKNEKFGEKWLSLCIYVISFSSPFSNHPILLTLQNALNFKFLRYDLAHSLVSLTLHVAF